MPAPLRKHPPSMTLSDFLTWEREQPERYEFVDGEITMMTGGTVNHSRLIRNIGTGLNTALGPCGCEAFMDALKVITADSCFYPDVVLTCKPVRGDADTIDEPSFIAEVLSPSTAHVDRLRKWEGYQALPSLAAYLMVTRDRVRAELYVRQGAGWLYMAFTHLDAIIEVPDLGLSLPLAEIYRGVSFDEPEAQSA